MASEVLKPDIPNLQECLEYLDFLRETGVTNMFGAAPYLSEGLDLDVATARKVLAYWMATFGERHPAK
jgi:hypothetical protein